MHRFYNAGDRIDEVFMFSLPEGADIHVLGRWPFIAPKESWIEVPRELAVQNSTIAVQFASDIKRRFGKRGVVMLDPSYDPSKEDADKPLEAYPVAPTEELVIARGGKLWDNFLEEMCRAHFEDVQNAMSSGGAPRAARGFTIHALRLKGYKDPAHDYFLGMKEGQQGKAPAGMSAEMTGILSQMQKSQQLLTSVVLAMATGQKIDPELLKHAITPDAAPAPKAPAAIPENAGSLQVEGQRQTSLEQRINRKSVEYETLNSKPADKRSRAAAAAKEL